MKNLKTLNIKCNECQQAESLVDKLRKMMANNEPIKAEVTPIYTDKQDGAKPEYDIRADKWEFAQAAMSAGSKAAIAQGDNRPKTTATTTTEEEH